MSKQAFCTSCGNSIQKLMEKRYIRRTHLCFSASYSKTVIQIYCTFKIEKFVSHKSFVIFSFFQLGYIRETYSKYFQNSIPKTPISSVTQKSTTRSSFLGILHTFNLCSKSLYLN